MSGSERFARSVHDIAPVADIAENASNAQETRAGRKRACQVFSVSSNIFELISCRACDRPHAMLQYQTMERMGRRMGNRRPSSRIERYLNTVLARAALMSASDGEACNRLRD